MDTTAQPHRRTRRLAVMALAIVTALAVAGGVIAVRQANAHDIAEIKARCGAFEGDDLSFGDHAGGEYGTVVVVRRSGRTWVGHGPARWGIQHRAADDEVEGDLSIQSDGTATFTAFDGTSAEMTPTDYDGGYACAI